LTEGQLNNFVFLNNLYQFFEESNWVWNIIISRNKKSVPFLCLISLLTFKNQVAISKAFPNSQSRNYWTQFIITSWNLEAYKVSSGNYLQIHKMFIHFRLPSSKGTFQPFIPDLGCRHCKVLIEFFMKLNTNWLTLFFHYPLNTQLYVLYSQLFE
jgi:hypothetical protein